MWKIQIFIFVEAILLTLAALTILSVDFSRFIVLMVLFLLLLYYYFGKHKANFLLIALSVLLFFIVMLNPFCDCSHFICSDLWFVDCLSLYVQGK